MWYDLILFCFVYFDLVFWFILRLSIFYSFLELSCHKLLSSYLQSTLYIISHSYIIHHTSYIQHIIFIILDGINDPTTIAINAASLALMLSRQPWNGPIGCVRIGRIDGVLILNPTVDQMMIRCAKLHTHSLFSFNQWIFLVITFFFCSSNKS